MIFFWVMVLIVVILCFQLVLEERRKGGYAETRRSIEQHGRGVVAQAIHEATHYDPNMLCDVPLPPPNPYEGVDQHIALHSHAAVVRELPDSIRDSFTEP